MDLQPLNLPLVPLTLPPVVRWFYVYSAVLCVVYLAVAAFCLPFFLVEPAELEMGKTEAVIIGVMMLVMGLVFFVLFLMPCFLLACVPLLLFWLKPEAKAWFGKS